LTRQGPALSFLRSKYKLLLFFLLLLLSHWENIWKRIQISWRQSSKTQKEKMIPLLLLRGGEGDDEQH
jgi:hypothetical protein